MTPQDLLKAGYHEFSWNGGIIMEYWKPLYPDSRKKEAFDYHIGVRFGERTDCLFLVYLFFPSLAMPLPNITTLKELECLYTLLVQ